MNVKQVLAEGVGKLLPEADTLRDRILAALHLHAVLPRLGELLRLDPVARKLASELTGTTIEFAVARGPRVALTFEPCGVTASNEPGGWNALGLLFPTAKCLNKMFAGEQAFPIPYKGLHKAMALKALTPLTERLTHFLKPSQEDLADPSFRAAHVEMSLMVGLSAACELAMLDPDVAKAAAALHDGEIEFRVIGGPAVHVVIRKLKLWAVNGPANHPLATLEMRDLDFAVELIAGRVDTFAAVGLTDVRLTGDANLADEFNMIFDRVGLYLK